MTSSAPFFATRPALALLAAMVASVPGFAQTWSASGNGTWSTAANWTPASVPAGGNTAILGDAVANRTVTYDGAASGSLGTLTITQTSAATNALDLQRSLNLTNALTLGAADGGAARIILGSTSGAGFALTSANGVTLNQGGNLVFTSTGNGASGFNSGSVSSSTPVTVSGGALTLQASTGTSSSSTAITAFGGNFTMSSGVIAIDNSTGGADRRLALNSPSINITGGSFAAAPRSGAQIQFNNASVAANITFNPASLGGNISFNFQSDAAQNFTTGVNLTSKMDLRGLGVKTLASTASGNGVGSLFLWDTNGAAPGSAVTVRLGSNLTLSTGSSQPAVNSGGHTLESGRINAAIDTNGFTFDLASGASNGTWTPNMTAQAGATNTVWTLSGNGSFRANAFNLAAGNVTTNLGAGLVLNAVGGNATVNDLGNNGTINSASIFRYSGSASASNPATLAWARDIGQIEVRSGVLKLTTTAAAGSTVGKISVTTGGTLSIGSEANLGSAPATPVADYLVLDGGTLTNSAGIGTWSANRGIVLAAAGGTVNTTTTFVTGVITGTGALTKTGPNYLWTSNNVFSGGFIFNQGWIRPRAYSTVSGGVVTGSPVGTGILTINGGGLGGASGYSPTYFVTQTNVAADFAVNTGAIATNQNKMVTFAGPINLLGAQRTVSLGSYTTAANSIATPYGGSVVNGSQGGSASLNFISADGVLNTVITNGDLRFVRESLGGAGDYAALNFDAATFGGGAGLTIGANVITTMSQANPFGEVAGDQPRVTVESGGYFNLSDANGARSPRIRTLAGAGVVTSLVGSGASTLTLNPQSGDTATFSGRIVDGSTLNGTLGITSSATVALSKTGAGTQVLSGPNSYSGDTSVSAGVLSLGQASLADGADVVITGGGKLDLNYIGTDNIRSLYIAGVQQAAGSYGATGSGAAIVNDTVFSGAGTLTVATGPVVADPFVAWATGYGLSGTSANADADPDGDGTANLLEWILGGNPTVSDASSHQAVVSKDAAYLDLSFSRADETEAAATLVARWGVDLATWSEVTVGAGNSGPDANGVLVVVVENGSSPDTVTVRVPLANAAAGRLFANLRAAKN